MLPKKKLGLTARFGHFSKWPPVKNENFNILVCGTPRDLILVSIPIFSGSMNSMRTIKKALANLVQTAILNFKMATKNRSFRLISVSETPET